MNEDQILTRFGQRVRQLRISKDMTIEELALESGIDPTHMGDIELGKRNPTLLVMAKIADALSTSVARLLDEK